MNQNQQRVILSDVYPSIDGGLYAIKRIPGQRVTVECDVLCDGHDVLRASLLYRHQSEKKWTEVPMHHQGNDRFGAHFDVTALGQYTYCVSGWVDEALNWLSGVRKKVQADQIVTSELLEGALYVPHLLKSKGLNDRSFWEEFALNLADAERHQAALAVLFDPRLDEGFMAHPTKMLHATTAHFSVLVERKKALFSTWYEFFPRSSSPTPGAHGTFKDCMQILPKVAAMGFDTLYFPPVHPIGEVNRKGKNNATDAQKGDVGSPWGIGSHLGGHKDLHPELGTLADFKQLVQSASDQGIEIAMDFALQAAPDHPWVKQHPEWFKWRPDGSIQYAENPPKKYQDILPIYFETPDWKALWDELLSCCLYWVEEVGIRVFRVDNPHTKPFHFWAWLMAEVRAKHPEVLFLAEAFTRPKIMQQLAKSGYTQGYTYFTWRMDKHQMMEYVTELTQSLQKEYFRPNFWPNTPDINPFHLQGANESMHLSRYFMAATLSSNTGVYGPVYEMMVSDAVPGREEYMDSEKYAVRHWDWNFENKITVLMSKINRARYDLIALQQTNNIVFCGVDNPQLMAYLKWDDAQTCWVLCVVSFDPYYTQKGTVEVPLHLMGLEGHAHYRVHDVITQNTYDWQGTHNYVEIHPVLPFHLFHLTQ